MSSSIPPIREQVASLVNAGLGADEIERTVRARTALTEEQLAELWLYAWARRWRTAQGGQRLRVPEPPLD